MHQLGRSVDNPREQGNVPAAKLEGTFRSLYFPRSSVDEQGASGALPEPTVSQIRSQGPSLAGVNAIVTGCSEEIRVDLLALRYRPRLDQRNPHVHKSDGNRCARCGVLAASIPAEDGGRRVLSCRRNCGIPAFRRLRRRRLLHEDIPVQWRGSGQRAAEGGARAPVLLQGAIGEDVEGVVGQAPQRRGNSPGVYVKERRQPHSRLIAGLTPELLGFVDVVAE